MEKKVTIYFPDGDCITHEENKLGCIDIKICWASVDEPESAVIVGFEDFTESVFQGLPFCYETKGEQTN